jgi:hypothetical protein
VSNRRKRWRNQANWGEEGMERYASSPWEMQNALPLRRPKMAHNYCFERAKKKCAYKYSYSFRNLHFWISADLSMGWDMFCPIICMADLL